MQLRRLKLRNFRNLRDVEIDFAACPLPRSTIQFVPRSFPQSVAWV